MKGIDGRDYYNATAMSPQAEQIFQQFKKVYDSMTNYTNAGYQWFQVAELGYDSFMVRHSRS